MLARWPARSLSVSSAVRTPGHDETVLDKPGRDIGDTGLGRLRRIGQVREPGTETTVAEQFREPLRRPMTLGDQHDPPAVGEPGPYVTKRTVGVAAVGLGRFHIDPERLTRAVAGWSGGAAGRLPALGASIAPLVGAERGQRPPGKTELVGGRADLLDRPEGGAAEVDRRPPASRRVHPGRVEELLAGPDKLGGAGADAFRIAGEHAAAGRNMVDQQIHPLGEHGREGLHALHADAFRQLAEYLGKTGVFRCQPFGGSTDRGGEKQFAARRRPQPAGGRLHAALVSDLEVPDLFHRVAEEVDPQRMLLDGREDVEDAAADREVAALLDQVRACVPGLDKPGEHVLKVRLVAGPQPDRLDFT